MSDAWATLLAGAILVLAIPGAGTLRPPPLTRRELRRRERAEKAEREARLRGPGTPPPLDPAPRVPVARVVMPPRLAPSIVAPSRPGARADVVDALVGLGFRPGPAAAAVDTARARYQVEPELEAWLRDALRALRPPAPRAPRG